MCRHEWHDEARSEQATMGMSPLILPIAMLHPIGIDINLSSLHSKDILFDSAQQVTHQVKWMC